VSETWQFPLTVDLGTTSVRLKPGGSADVSVTIRNISQVVQHYEVIVVGLPADQLWHTDVPVTKLRPGETGIVTLTLALPDGFPILGGDYLLGVLVRSPYDPASVCRSEELTLSVEAVTDLTLAVYPEVIQGSAGGPFTITLGNQGNTPLPVTLSGADDAGKASFRFVPPEVWLRPGTTAQLQGAVDAPARLTGSERRSQITLTAHVGQQPGGTAKLTLLQPPRIPPAVFKVLGVVLAVAVVAASILVGAVLARQPNQQASAPPSPPSTQSSSQGQSPPAAAQLTVTPDPPVAQQQVTFNATTSGTITGWLWTLTDDKSNVLRTNQGPQKFSYTFEQAGGYVLELAITSEGGTTTTTMTFQVQPAPPSVQPLTDTETVKPGQVATAELACPAGKMAIGGGVYLDPNQASNLQIEASSPTDDGGWATAVRNHGSPQDLKVTLAVTCVTKPQGLVVQRTPSTGNSGDTNALLSSCPTGMVVLGGGGGLVQAGNNPTIQATLTTSAPVRGSPSWNGWKIGIAQNAEYAIEVVALCAPAPADYAVEVDVKTVTGNGTVSAEATCTAGAVLSGGASIDDSAGTAGANATVVIPMTAPASASGASTAQGWTVAMQYTAPEALPLATYAVCASLP